MLFRSVCKAYLASPVKHNYVAFKAGIQVSFVNTDLDLPTQYYLVATVRNSYSASKSSYLGDN